MSEVYFTVKAVRQGKRDLHERKDLFLTRHVVIEDGPAVKPSVIFRTDHSSENIRITVNGVGDDSIGDNGVYFYAKEVFIEGPNGKTTEILRYDATSHVVSGSAEPVAA